MAASHPNRLQMAARGASVAVLRRPAQDEITVADVDRYEEAKLAEADELRRRLDAGENVRHRHGQRRRALPPVAMNKKPDLPSAGLDVAEERELVARNPAQAADGT